MSNSTLCSLSLELLGTFRLEISGQTVPLDSWKSRKALLLLKYLATRYGEKIPSDVLIDFLWPDSDFESATHTLHTTIYYLRKTLKEHTPAHLPCPDWIQFGNGLYWLNTSEEVSIDVHDFLKLYRESEEIEQQDPAKSLEICWQALTLYRDSFLPEDLYADWTESIREHCRSKYVELTLRASRLLVSCKGDYKEAASICKAALDHAPYREDLHQLLIQCLMAMGRSPEAVLQYNDCAKILRDELELEPSLETKALLQEVKCPSTAQDALAYDSSMETDGILVCGRVVFKSILDLEKRRLDRRKQPLVLMTIALDEKELSLDVEDIFSALTQSMRKGDVATRWSQQLLAILLTETDRQGAAVVQHRILGNLAPNIAAHCQFTTHVLTSKDEVISELVDKTPG